MAFSRSALQRVGPVNSTSPTIWTYASSDAIADIDGSGYFNDAAAMLQVGDLIYCVGNGVPGILWVSGNTRDLTATPPVEGVVDCNNTLALSTIDSD